MRIRAIPYLCLLTLASCASPPATPDPTPAPTAAIRDGHWKGKMTATSTTELEGKSFWILNIWLASCGGQVRVWTAGSDGRYASSRASYMTASAFGSHLLYFVSSSEPQAPAWVEVQAWSFVEVDTQTAFLSWSRTVSNRRTDTSDPLRVFGQSGWGNLERTSSICDITDVNPG